MKWPIRLGESRNSKKSPLHRKSNRRITFEPLESRLVLATSTFLDGVLEIRAIDIGSSQNGEILTIARAGNNVTLNGQSPIFGQSILASEVKAIHLYGSLGPDSINLIAVTPQSFPLIADFQVSASGGEGSDTIHGSSFADIIDGGDGNDSIFGQGGADTINGGKGGNTIYGGDGNDRIFVGLLADSEDLYQDPPSNTAFGELGNDELHGSGLRDSLYGGEGDDHLVGYAASDIVYGDGGRDTLAGGEGIDVVCGGLGRDTFEKNLGLVELFCFESIELATLEDNRPPKFTWLGTPHLEVDEGPESSNPDPVEFRFDVSQTLVIAGNATDPDGDIVSFETYWVDEGI
jgi:RTX calcium-binding nonapeptide repeat (4 copies)